MNMTKYAKVTSTRQIQEFVKGGWGRIPQSFREIVTDQNEI